MSVLGEHPEAMINKKDLQIWNNAAFDDSESSNSNTLIKSSSWSSLKESVLANRSLDSLDSSKENRSPLPKSPVSVSARSPVVLHPLKNHPNKIFLSKQGVFEKPGFDKDKKIDEEIEQIENEIGRLSARLEALRLEKSEQNVKNLEKQGRVVAAKFMGPVKNRDSGVKKIEESRTKIQRRGFSLGPNEIMGGSNSKSRQLGKQEIFNITPIQSIQNRRKSCFWKLQDIEEEEKGKKNLSLSPKSRKLLCKPQVPRQAVTTVGSKKGVKKDDGVLSSIQPKKLFTKDGGEKSVLAKKPGRIIPSRYNQSTVNSALRKRSLPENDSITVEKKRPSSVGTSCGAETRVKKRWEIPNEIVVAKKLDLDENENGDLRVSGNVMMPCMLPRIKAVRCVNESETPRDSGPAKRVAELVGKKSYFSCEDEEEEANEASVCQALSFEEDFQD